MLDEDLTCEEITALFVGAANDECIDMDLRRYLLGDLTVEIDNNQLKNKFEEWSESRIHSNCLEGQFLRLVVQKIIVNLRSI